MDLWRSRRLRKVARRYGSEALEADALHFASDIWASAAVIVGLGASWLGAVEHISVAALCRSGGGHCGLGHDFGVWLAAGLEGGGRRSRTRFRRRSIRR